MILKFLKEILTKRELTLEELILCFEKVKEMGNTVVIKFDGQRPDEQYTIFISFSSNEGKEMIRSDSMQLREGMLEVLEKYVLSYN